MKLFPDTVLALGLSVLPLACFAADLQISVSGGPVAPADLHVALFDGADAFESDKPIASQKMPLQGSSTRLTFHGLVPGRYAVKLFADGNGNQKLDRNLVGLPTERYGFSNDASGRMGPPTFDAAAMTIESDTSIDLHLR